MNETVSPESAGRSPAGSRKPPSQEGVAGTVSPFAVALEIAPTTFAVPVPGSSMPCLGTEAYTAYQRLPMSTQPAELAASPGAALRCGRQNVSVTVEALAGAVGTSICTPPSSRRPSRSCTPSVS